MSSSSCGPELLLSSLSVFLPAYNEQDSVVGAVEGLLAVLPAVARTYEIVVVDDGSTDATADVTRALSRSHPGTVRLVCHSHNRGYGAALRTGFASAQHDYVFFTDGDAQFDPSDLLRLAAALGEHDAVLGHRIARADPWHRRAYARLWNAVVRRLIGVRVRDLNCAFKLFRRPIVARLELRSDGATASAELLALVLARGGTFVEIPVAHRPRTAGSPTGGRPAVIARAFRELVALRRRLRALPPPREVARTARREPRPPDATDDVERPRVKAVS